jgi:Fibronectin type III-like domain/PA14 domain
MHTPVADPRLFSTTRRRSDQGLTWRHWTHGQIHGAPARTKTDDVFMRIYFGQDLTPDPQHNLAMQWTGYFWPPTSGEYLFSLFDHGTTTVLLDGKAVISPSVADEAPPMYETFRWRARYTKVVLQAGRPYAFRMDRWRAAVTLRNTGGLAGAEVVQLYVETPRSTGEPLRQLKGFQRVRLDPGEQREMSFAIGVDDLCYWDTQRGRWDVAAGTYRLHVGRSSRDLPLSVSFDVS